MTFVIVIIMATWVNEVQEVSSVPNGLLNILHLHS